MKIKLFFLLMLAATISGFSQPKKEIDVFSDKAFETTIDLRAFFGKGNEITVPVSILFSEQEKRFEIKFKGNSDNGGKFIYSFSETMFYKDVMKKNPKIWFDKGLKNKDKAVERSIDPAALENVKSERAKESIRMLDLGDPGSTLTFSFVKDPKDSTKTCKIPIRLYAAKKQLQKAKSEKDRKIEYLTKFTLIITVQEICEQPELRKTIEDVTTEIKKLESQEEDVAVELELLPDLFCPCHKVKGLKEKESDNKERITNIIDPRYEQFADCKNLQTTITDYNLILSARNKAISAYNARIKELKKNCKDPIIETPPPPIQCSLVSQANKKLATLLLKIKNEEQALPASKREFESIKKTVEDPDFQRCEEYNGFKDFCSRIGERLKQ